MGADIDIGRQDGVTCSRVWQPVAPSAADPRPRGFERRRFGGFVDEALVPRFSAARPS